ncbi:MAG: protein phosphatase CheZ [Burkholderiaceae bacterium]|nr:protein phosphatase CheZ [Burkholderiaceae bacterium]
MNTSAHNVPRDDAGTDSRGPDAQVPGLHRPDGSLDAEAVYARLGELTRTLHNALRALGYDREIEQAAVSMLPEARSRLSYIARLTGEAAEKVLNAVDSARGEQDQLAINARDVEAALKKNPVAAVAGGSVLNFVTLAQGQAERTNAHLTDIMMAQDFHDLTGQVTRKLVDMVQRIEGDLLKLLLEATPPAQRPPVDAGWLSGPVIEAAERTDVVDGQQQVDDLLESLGF